MKRLEAGVTFTDHIFFISVVLKLETLNAHCGLVIILQVG